MKKVKIMKEKQDGYYMLEAIYVVLITMALIFVSINISIVFYNRIVLQECANRAASGIAQLYGLSDREPICNYASYESVIGRNVYRELWGCNGGDDLEASAEKRAKWFAEGLLRSKEFYTPYILGETSPYVGVTIQKNELKKKIVVVEIRRTYGTLIKGLGVLLHPTEGKIADNYSIVVYGTATCYDLSYQINTISCKNELLDGIDDNFSFLKVIKNIEGTIKSRSNIRKKVSPSNQNSQPSQ